MAQRAVQQYAASILLICDAISISEKCYRYQAKLSSANQQIADWLLRLNLNKRNWGFGLCNLYLRNVRGFKWNQKRIDSIYREMEQRIGRATVWDGVCKYGENQSES